MGDERKHDLQHREGCRLLQQCGLEKEGLGPMGTVCIGKWTRGTFQEFLSEQPPTASAWVLVVRPSLRRLLPR